MINFMVSATEYDMMLKVYHFLLKYNRM